MTALFTVEQQEERLCSRSVVTENKKGKGRDEGREKPLTPPNHLLLSVNPISRLHHATLREKTAW